MPILDEGQVETPTEHEKIIKTIVWHRKIGQAAFGPNEWLMYDLMRYGVAQRRVGPTRFLIKPRVLTLLAKSEYARYTMIMNSPIAITVINISDLRGPNVPLVPQWKLETQLKDVSFDSLEAMFVGR
jgi:hypothetical protein